MGVKFALNAPYDSSTLANYKTWGQGIGQGMFNLSWVEQTGHGELVTSNAGSVHTWTNVAIADGQGATIRGRINPTLQGAWAGGTSYVGSNVDNGAADIVTNGGLTFSCSLSTQNTLTQAIQNTTISARNISSIAAASSGLTVYTFGSDSSATNAWVGYVFTIASATNPLNNGVFFCTASSATTLTLANFAGVVQAVAAGTSASSSANIGFLGTMLGTSGSTPTGCGDNGIVGMSITTTGFAASAGVNNTTGTVLASHTTGFGIVLTGANETHAGLATMNTAPASDTAHWVPYNFEIWKSNGPMSTTHPIYVKWVYTGTSSMPIIMLSVGTGVDANGRITGAMILSATAPLSIAWLDSVAAAGGSTLVETDFCGDADNLSLCLWRTGIAQGILTGSSQGPHVLMIDRAKTATGADSDAYVQVCFVGFVSSTTPFVASAVILNPTLGGIISKVGATGAAGVGWVGVPSFPVGSLSNFGATPPIPILPLVGYVANPCLGVVVFSRSDVQVGSLQPVWVYGAMHKFLVVNADCTVGSTSVNAVNGASCCAIRWESF